MERACSSFCGLVSPLLCRQMVICISKLEPVRCFQVWMRIDRAELGEEASMNLD